MYHFSRKSLLIGLFILTSISLPGRRRIRGQASNRQRSNPGRERFPRQPGTPIAGSSGRIGTIDAGGAEFLATHINALRATNPNTVVVSAGDMIGASPLLSALFHDEPTIEAFNLMRLDFNAVGNHEFDEGIDELLRMAKAAATRSMAVWMGMISPARISSSWLRMLFGIKTVKPSSPPIRCDHLPAPRWLSSA
jgi:hypothetical protein